MTILKTRRPQWRTLAAAVSALAACSAGITQAQEIQGGAAASGAPVPKAISVAQAKLSAADRDSANFLHSNMNYAQTRDRRASCRERVYSSV